MILKVYLPAILTIVIIANIGFVTLTSAQDNVKVKVNCENFRDASNLLTAVIELYGRDNPQGLENQEDRFGLSDDDAKAQLDRILDKC